MKRFLAIIVLFNLLSFIFSPIINLKANNTEINEKSTITLDVKGYGNGYNFETGTFGYKEEPIGGAAFSLINLKDGFEIIKDSNEKGKITFENIGTGKYILRQLMSNWGYHPIGAFIEVDITEENIGKTIDLGNFSNPNTTSFDGMGELTIYYKDKDTNQDIVRSQSSKISYNRNYETKQIFFENYELDSIIGETRGTIDGDNNDVHVTYLYTEKIDLLPTEKHRDIKSCDIQGFGNHIIDVGVETETYIKLDNIYNTINFNGKVKNINKIIDDENSIFFGEESYIFNKIDNYNPYNTDTLNIDNLDKNKILEIKSILSSNPKINMKGNSNISNSLLSHRSMSHYSSYRKSDPIFEGGNYKIITYHYTIDNDYNIIKKEKKITNINIDPTEICLEDRLIEVKKVDNETKEGLEGAEFEVYKSVPKDLTTTSKSITNKDEGYENIPDDEKFIYVTNLVTDNEGKAKYNEQGNFILKEIKAPKGYKLPEKVNNTIYNIPGNNCPVALPPISLPKIEDMEPTIGEDIEPTIGTTVIVGGQGDTEPEVVGTNTCNKEPFIIEIENEKEIIKSNILIQYLDKKTGEKISDDKRIEGNVGENYSTEKLEITNYNFDSVEGNENGIFTEEEIIIKYFYNKILPNISATEDKNKIPNDKGGEIHVLTNDNFNGNTPTPDNVTVTIVGEPRIPVTVNDEGKVIVPPTTETGIFTFEYKICDKNNPDNCSIAPVNVDLIPNIGAKEDNPKIPNDKGGEIPVLTNDNFNGNTPTPDNVTVTIVGEPRIPVTVNDQGKVIVPPTTETGIFTFEYKICDKNNPDNCSIAPVNVDLIPNIGAKEDNPKIPNDKGGEIPVLTNDNFNGNTPTPDNVTVTIVGEPRIPVTVNDQGKVIVPPTTETGIFTFEYKICDKNNPDNCSIAPVNVDLIPNIGAKEDNPKIPNDKGGEIPVLTNDNFNGNTPTPDNVTVTIVGEPRIPVTVNDQGKVIVPPTTETGIFTFEYKICDKNNPDNCSIAPVNVDLYEEPKSTPPEEKKGKVIINFLDKETSEKISEDKTIEGKVGENYLTEKIEIKNYTFDSVEGNENGNFTKEETIIKYFYNKNKEEIKKSTILVQHFDKETSEKLLEDKTYYGIVGEIYSIVKMSFDGYIFDSIEGKENGIYEENEITIKYFYTKIKAPTPPKEEPKKSTILIQYLDKDNRDKISEDKIIKGNIGDKYSTEKIEIANYTFDFVEGNEDGVYEENKITVKYFYTKIKNTTPKKPNLGGTPTTNVTLEEDPRVIIPEPPKETPKIEETPKEPEVPLESAPEEPFEFDPVPPMGEEPEILLPKVLPKTGAKEIAFFLLSLFSAYFIINRRLFIKK